MTLPEAADDAVTVTLVELDEGGDLCAVVADVDRACLLSTAGVAQGADQLFQSGR